MSGEIEVNEPVRVYDTSGPWGDPDSMASRTRAAALRADWIRERGDVDEIEGRAVSADGYGYRPTSSSQQVASWRKRSTFNGARKFRQSRPQTSARSRGTR